MANDTSREIFYIDQPGIISIDPLVVVKICMTQATTGSSVTFVTWRSEDTAITNGAKADVTTTVTASSGTLVSVGNFPTANVNPFQIIKITNTSSNKNLGKFMIATNADDDTITVYHPLSVHGGQTTVVEDDAAGSYCWKIIDTATEFKMKGTGVTNDTCLFQMDFGPQGFWFPNLAIHTMTASAVVYIFNKTR
jgi:hypothetical protein